MKKNYYILLKFEERTCKVMKIAFLVVNLGCGGVERTVAYLSAFFAEQGEDVSIICISDEQFYEVSDKVRLLKLCIPSECNGFVDRAKKIILRFKKIHESLKKLQPDCLICLDAEMIRYIYWHHRFMRFKLITSERNNPLMDSPKKRKRKYKSFRNSNGIVFQTERAQNCYPRDIAERGIVIPNAVGNDYVYRLKKSVERRKVITAAGRLTEQKDYPTLLKAFARFHIDHKDYKLEIYGKGEELDSLISITKQLDILEAVEFKGAVKDAINPISTSSCYVMSSLYEGMPNALMEAMAVGVPCISTDCSFGPRELITHEKDGLLVPVGDVRALENAIRRMIDDKEFAKECSSAASKILERQSIPIIARRYLDYVRWVSHI